MSSMRNAVQRRNHKERAQPFERKRFGILEKHKDYQLRSRDYNAKKARLKILRSKAAERNPDEFYFAMTKSTTAKGVHVSQRGNTSLNQDAVRLLKTQDAGYLRVASAVERRKKQKLEQELHFLGGDDSRGGSGDDDNEWEDEDVDMNGSQNNDRRRHTVFVDNRDAAESFTPAEYFDTHPDLVNRTHNRPRLSQLQDETIRSQNVDEADDIKAEQLRQQGRERKYKELEARMKREEELNNMERELDKQRERMGKGGPRSGVTKAGRKFVVKERKK